MYSVCAGEKRVCVQEWTDSGWHSRKKKNIKVRLISCLSASIMRVHHHQTLNSKCKRSNSESQELPSSAEVNLDLIFLPASVNRQHVSISVSLSTDQTTQSGFNQQLIWSSSSLTLSPSFCCHVTTAHSWPVLQRLKLNFVTRLTEKLFIQNASGKFTLKKYPSQIPETEVITALITR